MFNFQEAFDMMLTKINQIAEPYKTRYKVVRNFFYTREILVTQVANIDISLNDTHKEKNAIRKNLKGIHNGLLDLNNNSEYKLAPYGILA
jgi:hypothetical protein